jgi:DNA repair exonuclease SbcCD ATPase subunit
MSRGLLIFVILILAGGLAGSYGKLRELIQQNQDLLHENQKQQEQIRTLQSELLKVHIQEQSAYLAQRTTVENLREKIKQEQENLIQAEGRLQKAKNMGPPAKDLPGLQEKQKEQRTLVEEIENSLNDLQARDHQLDQQEKSSQQAYGQNQKVTAEELSTQIKAQEDRLKSMYEEAGQLRKQMFDPVAQQKLTELQSQIAQQKAAVAQLKEQRGALSQQYKAEKNLSHAQIEAQRAEMKRSEQQLRSRLSAEKSHLARTEKDLQGRLAGRRAREDEIKKAAQDYKSLQKSIEEDQTQLRAEELKLQSLQASDPSSSGGTSR